MSVETKFCDQINRTPAVELALRANAELIAAGLAEPLNMVSWDNKAIIGFVDGAPVGVITFYHIAYAKQLDIQIGYVLPTSRGQGVYRAMWNALVVKARELNALVIQGNTHLDNAPMRAAAKALGRIEIGVILKFNVPEPE